MSGGRHHRGKTSAVSRQVLHAIPDNSSHRGSRNTFVIRACLPRPALLSLFTSESKRPRQHQHPLPAPMKTATRQPSEQVLACTVPLCKNAASCLSRMHRYQIWAWSPLSMEAIPLNEYLLALNQQRRGMLLRGPPINLPFIAPSTNRGRLQHRMALAHRNHSARNPLFRLDSPMHRSATLTLAFSLQSLAAHWSSTAAARTGPQFFAHFASSTIVHEWSGPKRPNPRKRNMAWKHQAL